jgi:hypothetical protein
MPTCAAHSLRIIESAEKARRRKAGFSFAYSSAKAV